MLVLTRREDEQVVLGGEVKVTVEEICGPDGTRIFGARARLGFQMPRDITIHRSEWRPRDWDASRKGRTGGAPPPLREGSVVEIPDARVRVRVQLPRKIPVCLNGSPTQGVDLEERLDDVAHSGTVVHHITCHKEDRITICRNITVVAAGVELFIFRRTPSLAVG